MVRVATLPPNEREWIKIRGKWYRGSDIKKPPPPPAPPPPVYYRPPCHCCCCAAHR